MDEKKLVHVTAKLLLLIQELEAEGFRSSYSWRPAASGGTVAVLFVADTQDDLLDARRPDFVPENVGHPAAVTSVAGEGAGEPLAQYQTTTVVNGAKVGHSTTVHAPL